MEVPASRGACPWEVGLDEPIATSWRTRLNRIIGASHESKRKEVCIE